MAIDTMKKGSIEMLTLFCCVKKTHMVISLCRKSRHEAKVSLQCRMGLYPLLYRLADDGYITGEEVVTRMSTGRSRMRVIYHIETPGGNGWRL